MSWVLLIYLACLGHWSKEGWPQRVLGIAYELENRYVTIGKTCTILDKVKVYSCFFTCIYFSYCIKVLCTVLPYVYLTLQSLSTFRIFLLSSSPTTPN